mgnify:CR=1 FL=1
MVAALMANGGDDGARARWKSEGEEQAGEKDLEGCRRGLGDSSLSPRRCGGVGRRAGPAGTARGVRPRSVEQTRRGEDDKGRGEVLGRWTDSAGWASGPRPLGSRGGFLSFCFLFTFYLFFFSVLFLVSLLFCFSKIPKWHLICCYQICHNHKKFHPKII